MKQLILLITLILIIISGCATAPKPYTANLNINHQIEFSENFALLSEALQKTFPDENMNNNCLTFDIDTGHVITHKKKLAEVCYSVINNQIQRNARTYSSLNVHLNDWFASIVNRQHNLEGNYVKLASRYISNTERQKREKAEFQTKLSNLKVDFKDETGKLNESMMNELRKSLIITPDQPNIHIKYENIIGRIKLRTASNIPPFPHYKDFSDNITIRVTGYKVNTIPTMFELTNNDLKVTAFYNFDRSKVDEVLFANSTNDFITVQQIAGYFDGKVRDNILKAPLTIPPMTKKSVEWHNLNTFPLQDSYDQFLYKESTNYGFSVSYKLSQKATSDTLVKIKEFIAK